MAKGSRGGQGARRIKGDYRYHATSMRSYHNIMDTGELRAGRGHMGDGIYFAYNEESAKEWGTDTGSAGDNPYVLRVSTKWLEKHTNYGDIDPYVGKDGGGGEGSTEGREPIPIEALEIKVGDKWRKLKDIKKN